MLCNIVYRETYNILSQAQSSTNLCSFCFEDTETVFTVGYAVESGSLEAHGCRIVDDSHTQTIALACPTSIQDGSTLCVSSGVRT